MGTYHGPSGPCHRCGRGGHLARDCSLHTCFRCNGRGHMAWECVEGVTCSKCGEKGHLQRNCKNVSCHKCGRKGHIAKFCNDPFAKAAEVEKNEHQQALLQASASGLNFPTAAERSFAVKKGAATLVHHKETQGPWDGLGVTSRDAGLAERASEASKTSSFRTGCVANSSTPISTRKRSAADLVKAVVSERLRIVGVKRNEIQKCDVSVDVQRRKVRSSCTTGGSPLEVGNTESQWKGLVGYESEDCDDHSLLDLCR